MNEKPCRPTTIVQYFKTMEAAITKANQHPSYRYLGKGYNENFRDYWAVMVKNETKR